MKKYQLLYWSIFVFLNCGIGFSQSEDIEPGRILINEVRFIGETDSVHWRGKKKLEYVELLNTFRKRKLIFNLYLSNNSDVPDKWKIRPKQGLIKGPANKIRPQKTYAVFLSPKTKQIRGGYVEEFEKDSDTLFLFLKTPEGFLAQDTFVMAEKTYPQVRMPDGGAFTQGDLLTPGDPNLFEKDAISRRAYGILFSGGLTSTKGPEFQNTTFQRPGYSIGIYSRRDFGKMYFDYGIRMGFRGYKIKASTSLETSIAFRDSKTEGQNKLTYLDFPLSMNARITRKWSAMLGVTLSILIKAKMEYDTEYTTTIKSTGATKSYTEHYVQTEINHSIDFVDFSVVPGIRYSWNKFFSTSIYGMVDFFGLNLGVLEGISTQHTRGIYVCTEFNLFNSFRKRRIESFIKSR